MKIEIKNIAKRFGRKQVLKSICFSAQSGDCIGILGGNGSGKSTLISILAGVLKSDEGEFLYDGKNLFRHPRQRADLVGYVPQGTPLIEELTAYDNLSMWYDKHTVKTELAGGVLALLGINDFLKVPVSKMSGGMKKRLSIGCAISKRSPILLLDEPMAALDLACKQEIAEYLKRHKSKGGIIVLVTHDVLELELCNKCYIVNDGVLEPFEFDGDIKNLVKKL